MFPVGSSPTYTIAKEMWDLIKAQPNLAFVVDFHDGFVNSLGNTLIHTRQARRARLRKIRDALNEIRPKAPRGHWRALTEPISGSLTARWAEISASLPSRWNFPAVRLATRSRCASNTPGALSGCWDTSTASPSAFDRPDV